MRSSPREEAARCIQAAWRGWRARQRVVWAVRAELSAFMTEMERAVEMESRLLGLATPQRFEWLAGGDGHGVGSTESCTRNALHLPRIHDSVFGWSSSFPNPRMAKGSPIFAVERTSASPEIPAPETAQGTANHLHAEMMGNRSDDILHQDEANATPTEEQPGTSEALDGEQACMDSPPKPATCASPGRSDISGDDSAGGSTDQAVTLCETSQSTAEAASAVARSAVCEPVLSTVSSPTVSTVSVESILATHSKNELCTELEWARQALRDRLRYLHQRSRSEAVSTKSS